LIFNYFQTALVLYEERVVPLVVVVEVARSLIDRSGYTRERLRNSLEDLSRRGYLAPTAATVLRRELVEAGIIPGVGAGVRWPRRLWRRVRRRARAASGPRAPAAWSAVDYPRLIDAWVAAGRRLGGETP